MKTLLSLMILLHISACSSLSKEECTNLNWFERAMSDIQKGEDWQQELTNYHKTCEDHGIEINKSEYIRGVSFEGAKRCSGDDFFHDGKWQRIGQRDALNGKGPEHLSQYVNYCEKYQVKPDQKNYMNGYSLGLAKFCTYEYGLTFGEKGGKYLQTCDAETRDDFLKGFNIGIVVYRANKLWREAEQARFKVENMERETVDLEQEIDDIDEDLRVFERRERRFLDDYQRRIEDKEREIRYAELDGDDREKLKRLEGELADIKSQYYRDKEDLYSSKEDKEDSLIEKKSELSELRSDLFLAKKNARELAEKAKKAKEEAKKIKP